MIRASVLLLFVAVLCFSCDHATKFPSVFSSVKPVIIDIRPFSDISDESVKYVSDEIGKVYPNVVVWKKIEFPASAFYAPRNRYRADSLIRFLDRDNIPGHVVIGLTDRDISTTNGDIKDWGVMGLGFCPGNACIASSFRLSKKEKNMQLFKVAIHELGHTQGLPHCEVKNCFMRDAEGRNPTAEETEFCPACKKRLIGKGWKL